MPPLLDFSDNPILTRIDFLKASVALVKPLTPYKSPSGARIKLATSTAAGFSETSAQLEGYARPLWVVPFLLQLKSSTSDPTIQNMLSSPELDLESWIHGLKEGTDPSSKDYWGDLQSFDQRMVEMETIAFALLVHPSAFSFEFDSPARVNLVAWLRQINAHIMPHNNWLFFRVLVNLALVLRLDVPLDEVRSHIDDALAILDTFYLGDGWSADGVWGNVRKQVDYYSGSFAIQFAQCLFVKFASSLPVYATRVQEYKDQARAFAKDFWRYFDVDGAAIPFGRSMTYRFAIAAFWAGVSYAGIELDAPMEKGAIKGLLLRHLRWWTHRPHIFDSDGTPNIGFTYSNMYMAEEYNSPQSVYWCLKSFLVLGLEEDDAFWTSNELPHPLSAIDAGGLERIRLIWPPRQILVGAEEHHFMVSSGQSTTKPFKAREAKYAKSAYSSAFGFNVPCGTLLQQIAPESTLAISLDDGEENWKVRYEPYDVEKGIVKLADTTDGGAMEEVPILVSKWKPWIRDDVVVQTILIPSMKRWPGWHLRVHRVSIPTRAARKGIPIRLVDGGFAVSAQTTQNDSIFEQPVNASFEQVDADREVDEGWWNDGKGSVVISEAGASGVVDLTDATTERTWESESVIIRADPNTNIISQRTLIPAMQYLFPAEEERNSLLKDDTVVFWIVTGVFAIQASAKSYLDRAWELWNARPTREIIDKSIQSSMK